MSKDLPRQMGHYRLDEKLGAGGMGVVYKATDTLLDRPVAIKMMHAMDKLGDDVNTEEIQARFLREAKAAGRIKSRYVAQVMQFGTNDEGDAYIVMELLTGVALSRVITKGGKMKPSRVVQIGVQICKGMQAAHDLGIVHRDLKPANVMLVDEEGDKDVVKILDFGVAKMTHETSTQGLTQAGALLGTLPFMAPEQIASKNVDARTDVYALGIILYRMFTGMTVWDADSLSDIVRHQLSSLPPSMFERVTNAEFSPQMDEVVLKCLEKDPAKRWQSMRELAAGLEAALAAAPASSLVADHTTDHSKASTVVAPYTPSAAQGRSGPDAPLQGRSGPGPAVPPSGSASARPLRARDDPPTPGTSPTGNGSNFAIGPRSSAGAKEPSLYGPNDDDDENVFDDVSTVAGQSQEATALPSELGPSSSMAPPPALSAALSPAPQATRVEGIRPPLAPTVPLIGLGDGPSSAGSSTELTASRGGTRPAQPVLSGADAMSDSMAGQMTASMMAHSASATVPDDDDLRASAPTKSRAPIAAAAGLVVVIAIIAVAFVALRGGDADPVAVGETATPTTTTPPTPTTPADATAPDPQAPVVPVVVDAGVDAAATAAADTAVNDVVDAGSPRADDKPVIRKPIEKKPEKKLEKKPAEPPREPEKKGFVRVRTKDGT